MALSATIRTTSDGSWPVTREAWRLLGEEIARLRADISTLAGQGLEEGIVRLPMLQAIDRLRTLDRVLDRAELVGEGSCAIGRRATVRDERGDVTSYTIVFPGDGDPSQGLISADSPLGAAILRAAIGDSVDVAAPEGRWRVTLVSID